MSLGTAPLSALDLAFVAGCALLILVSRRWVVLYALLALPGTLLHEASHWLAAAVLGGQPSSLSIVPMRTERGWRLGSVGIRRVRWFNAVPIGCAPLLLAPLAALAVLEAGRWPDDHWAHWTGLYVATATALACLPSIPDWKIVLSRPFGLVFYAVPVAAGLWLWLHR